MRYNELEFYKTEHNLQKYLVGLEEVLVEEVVKVAKYLKENGYSIKDILPNLKYENEDTVILNDGLFQFYTEDGANFTLELLKFYLGEDLSSFEEKENKEGYILKLEDEDKYVQSMVLGSPEGNSKFFAIINFVDNLTGTYIQEENYLKIPTMENIKQEFINNLFREIHVLLNSYGYKVAVEDIKYDLSRGEIIYKGVRRTNISGAEIEISGIVGKIYLPDSNGVVTTDKDKFIVRKFGYISPQEFSRNKSIDERMDSKTYEDMLVRKLRYSLLRNMMKYVHFNDPQMLDDFYEEMIEDSKKQWEIINGSMDGYGEWETEEELEKVRKISERITFSAEDSEYILKYKK